MRQEQFEALHAKEWAEFDSWLRFIQRTSRAHKRIDPSTLPFKTAEAPRRYRQVCLHLALARDRNFSLALVEHLHRMVQEGHDILYGPQSGFMHHTLSYIAGGFAADVRANWRWVLASAILFLGPYIAMMLAIRIWPDFIFTVMSYENVMEIRRMYSDSYARLGTREGGTSFMMFGYYIFNNISIAFRCFAGGLILGVGTIYALIFNGVFIGALEGDLVGTMGLGHNFYSFVAGHSSFELGAIVLSGAAGLKLGMALIAPGRRTRGEALRHTGQSVIGMVSGSAVMLVGAAMIEAFWSPLRLPLPIKVGVGLAMLTLTLAYFLFAGRRWQIKQSGARGVSERVHTNKHANKHQQENKRAD